MKFRMPTSRIDLIIFSTLIVVVALVAAAIALVNYRDQKAAVSNTDLPSAHTTDTTTHAGPSNDTTPSPTVTPVNPSRTPATTLAAPVGPTLNMHTVSLSNSSTLMNSTCSGVEGANCAIVATKNGQSITVSDTKVVTASGVELVWDAKKLTAGTWEVRAVASQNGQTAQSQPESLVVSP